MMAIMLSEGNPRPQSLPREILAPVSARSPKCHNLGQKYNPRFQYYRNLDSSIVVFIHFRASFRSPVLLLIITGPAQNGKSEISIAPEYPGLN